MFSLTISTHHKVLLKPFLVIDLTFVFEGCFFFFVIVVQISIKHPLRFNENSKLQFSCNLG